MSLHSRLAQLRPLMPLAALTDVTGSQWKPPSSGNMTVDGCFGTCIDLDGIIGSVRFRGGFASRNLVDGLRVNMPLGKVLLRRNVSFSKVNESNTLDIHTGDAGMGNQLIACILRDESLLHSFEMVRPGLNYGHGKSFDGAMAVVRYMDCDNNDEMLLGWAQDSIMLDKADRHKEFAHWLRSVATPDDWHAVTQNWNFDNP